MDVKEARAYIDKNKGGTFTILDVRQPKEYEKAHLKALSHLMEQRT